MDIFYLPYRLNTSFIIFDIDGTFTRSDILGHIFESFNISWIHKDVITMLNRII